MDREEERRELLGELDNEWHTLKHGNPIPGLYPQNGTEIAKVRGSSRIEDERTITTYEVVVLDRGEVVGRYRVIAEEAIADYGVGYEKDERD